MGRRSGLADPSGKAPPRTTRSRSAGEPLPIASGHTRRRRHGSQCSKTTYRSTPPPARLPQLSEANGAALSMANRLASSKGEPCESSATNSSDYYGGWVTSNIKGKMKGGALDVERPH